jgi:hypothetical protein
MVEGSRWSRRKREWVVGRRIRVALWIEELKRWMGGVGSRIRVCKSSSQDLVKFTVGH